MKNINEKLIKIQNELKAPKNQYNAFGKYNYRSCEDILEALKPLLEKHELSLNFNDEVLYIGSKYFLKTQAVLTDGEETIISEAYAGHETEKKGMDFSQITGAASSYARKYALNGLFLIDDAKDSDATNTGTAPKAVQSRSKTPKVSDETEQARQRLNKAVKAYAELHGGDYKALAEGVAKRPDYEPTAEFYNSVAMEFEMENQNA